jgi:hypothetical protein
VLQWRALSFTTLLSLILLFFPNATLVYMPSLLAGVVTTSCIHSMRRAEVAYVSLFWFVARQRICLIAAWSWIGVLLSCSMPLWQQGLVRVQQYPLYFLPI